MKQLRSTAVLALVLSYASVSAFVHRGQSPSIQIASRIPKDVRIRADPNLNTPHSLHTIGLLPSTLSSAFSLKASPFVWAIAHVIGGASGTPIVFSATKPGGWYRKLDLPPWTPPDRLFGPVWTTLYACMGVAAARVANTVHQNPTHRLALIGWMVHIILNWLWAPIFFGRCQLRLGLIVNGILWSSMGFLLPLFYLSNPLSAYLLLPYMAWLTFATILNFAICKRNPTKGGYNDAMFHVDLKRLQEDAAKYAGV